MFDRILVVCVGNICRSPLGEAMLKQALPTKTVISAGIAAEKSKLVDKPADLMMQTVATEHAIDLSCHRSQQLTEALCLDADLILVMEKGHIEEVVRISPSSRGKVMCYGHWLNQEIPDPYKQSREAFDYVFEQMQQATAQWKNKLT